MANLLYDLPCVNEWVFHSLNSTADHLASTTKAHANGPDLAANFTTFATFNGHCKQAENEINTARIPTNHGLGLISVQRLCREMGVPCS